MRRSGNAREDERVGELPPMHYSATACHPLHQLNSICATRRHINCRGDVLKIAEAERRLCPIIKAQRRTRLCFLREQNRFVNCHVHGGAVFAHVEKSADGCFYHRSMARTGPRPTVKEMARDRFPSFYGYATRQTAVVCASQYQK